MEFFSYNLPVRNRDYIFDDISPLSIILAGNHIRHPVRNIPSGVPETG
jgi:hypothetical protein